MKPRFHLARVKRFLFCAPNLRFNTRRPPPSPSSSVSLPLVNTPPSCRGPTTTVTGQTDRTCNEAGVDQIHRYPEDFWQSPGRFPIRKLSTRAASPVDFGFVIGRAERERITVSGRQRGVLEAEGSLTQFAHPQTQSVTNTHI